MVTLAENIQGGAVARSFQAGAPNPQLDLGFDPASRNAPPQSDRPRCAHCNNPCPPGSAPAGNLIFCCVGCQTVFTLLRENGLDQYYSLRDGASSPIGPVKSTAEFEFLDAPEVRSALVQYSDDKLTRLSLHIPSIHCIACVWLLENLFRILPGVGPSQVNFPLKQLHLSFNPQQLKLSQIFAELARLGYEPDLTLADLRGHRPAPIPRKLWLQIGVAGFAFGNTMLFSIPGYFGLDSFSGPAFQRLTGYLSLLLALPVVLFSASDYWRTAWTSLRRRLITIDLPIAAGIFALFAQSSLEVLTASGEGYFDSLAGLLFFLLTGRIFQEKAFASLNFDRDYASFFPLSVLRLLAPPAQTTERVALSSLKPGDRLLIRSNEILPADCKLDKGRALIDYSFVTGEANPVERLTGDLLYAGGRQTSGAIEVVLAKPVSQSYLTSLWAQDAFDKPKLDALQSITNRYSKRFTGLVLFIACAAAAYWSWAAPHKALFAFTAVLIVACPCALALAAPYTLGTAIRALSKRSIYLKNSQILEHLAHITSVVFDKTGTLTSPSQADIQYLGHPLSPPSQLAVATLASLSSHPAAIQVASLLAPTSSPNHPSLPLTDVDSFSESPGSGLEGSLQGTQVLLGSNDWMIHHQITPAPQSPSLPTPDASEVHLALNGQYQGVFHFRNRIRPETQTLVAELQSSCRVALLSGDSDREQERFSPIFGPSSEMRFRMSPHDKLLAIQARQDQGEKVMMVGDGLNDAGALRQSTVGVAVVENTGAFSPASDVILHSNALGSLPRVLRFSRTTLKIVQGGFLISGAYNAVGIAIAATGNLSPLVCAILMPLSSVSVVAFACLATHLAAKYSLGAPSPTTLATESLP